MTHFSRKFRFFIALVAALVLLFPASGCSPQQEDAPPPEAPSTPSIHPSPPPISNAWSDPPPGAAPFPPALLQQFEAVKKRRGASYTPRTRHSRPDGWARYTNRLFLESSPYLIQHAHNPVDWRPWGDEAFDEARKLNRPVLLSVGYSTCHWCHVMEEESFEDEEIARHLNEHYIAIKVDREERPDVDAIYMSAVQAITGRGGWPMTVWLTPDRKPFYGGTYFPARDGDRGATRGFLSVLKKVRKGYDDEKELVESSSRQLTEAIRKMMIPEAGDRPPSEEGLRQAVRYYKERFDRVNGGFTGAPKFPGTLNTRLLFRYARRTGDREALDMAKQTLEKMAAGGIYDHVGGGFHRYSTDAEWRVPHFEKMLYDNALLAMAYLEGWQAAGHEPFKRIVMEILEYTARDMTAPDGAFYSASDADSLTPDGHLEEGRFFTWAPGEFEQILGADRARVMAAWYAMGPTPDFEGRFIPRTPLTIVEVAGKLALSEKEALSVVEESRTLLHRTRAGRPAPSRDEKILTAWNGLMISAQARAGLILNDSRYVKRAARAARFVLDHLVVAGRLQRSHAEGEARHNAYLSDYAFLIAALLDLYEADHDPRWFQKAAELDGVLEKHYEDKARGGFFMTSDDHEEMIARRKPGHDGAEPSGNSVMILNLLRMGEFTDKKSYRDRAEKALTFFSGTLASSPASHSEMLLALDFLLDSPKEIVIVTPKGKKEEAEPFLEAFRKQFLPSRVLAVTAEGDDLETLSRTFSFVKGKLAIGGKTTAFVCEKGLCKLPARSPGAFAAQIGEGAEALKR